MPAAVVWSLNSLALALAEHDPLRARDLLRESVELGSAGGEEMSSGLLTACMVAARLRDWNLTLALAGRLLYTDRWFMAPLQVATCLALCTRAFAESGVELDEAGRGGERCLGAVALPGAGRSHVGPKCTAPGANDGGSSGVSAAN